MQEENEAKQVLEEEYKAKKRVTKIVREDVIEASLTEYEKKEEQIIKQDKREEQEIDIKETQEYGEEEEYREEEYREEEYREEEYREEEYREEEYREEYREEEQSDEDELEIDIKDHSVYKNKQDEHAEEDELEIDIKDHSVYKNKQDAYKQDEHAEEDELEVEIKAMPVKQMKLPVKEYEKEAKEFYSKEAEEKSDKKEKNNIVSNKVLDERTEQEELELLVDSIDDKPENEEEELIVLEDKKKSIPESIELKINKIKGPVDLYEEQKKNEPIIPLVTKKNKVRQRFPAKEEDIKIVKKPLSSVPNSYDEELPSTIFHDIDQSEMIYIRPGFSLVGSSDPDDDNPETTMYFYGYYIDKYPVTNFRYNMFLQETGHRKPINWSYSPKNADCPVTCVSWEDANAYAMWCGKRLPTEAEWENAARGTDGRNYPWGYEWDNNNCNNWYTDDPYTIKKMLDTSSGRGLTPVTMFLEGVSPYGVMDMVGNVAEWCTEWYEDVRKIDDHDDFKYLTFKIYRGGSWRDTDIRAFKTTYRNKAIYNRVFDCIGFRCSMLPKTS
jgi:formylglycine-generating enzyme required for sulfatase activity